MRLGGESAPDGAGDGPPDSPERWRGRTRARGLVTAITPLLLGLGVVASPACIDTDHADDGSYEARWEVNRTAPASNLRDAPESKIGDTLFLLPTPDSGPDPIPGDPVTTGDPEADAPDDSEAVLEAQSPEAEPEKDAPVSGVLTRHRERDPSWPDSVGRLLPRRYDDPERVSIENYFLYLPPGFEVDEDREWPVLLYLHGRSLRGDDLDLVKRYGIPSLIERGYEFPFIIVSPQLPDGQHWVDVERLWDLLDEEILEEYPVDEDRLYVTGFSMGAGGTWRFVYRYADEVAAAVPISATTPRPSEEWAEALEDLPMLVYHGDADDLVPYGRAVAMVEFLRERELPVELVTLEGGRHGIVQDVYRDPELYLWLLAHER